MPLMSLHIGVLLIIVLLLIGILIGLCWFVFINIKKCRNSDCEANNDTQSIKY